MEEKVRAIIVELNSLNLGEISGLVEKLRQSHDALVGLGQAELAAKVGEARTALEKGDVAAFRKLQLQVVSKLGHVR
ncbi:MAG: hypothetical protein U0166_20055 [Acidobacteriota bacterium]